MLDLTSQEAGRIVIVVSPLGGTSQDNKVAAFREYYFNLLNMKNAVEIKETQKKLNVAYVVQYMDKDMELEFYFG